PSILVSSLIRASAASTDPAGPRTAAPAFLRLVLSSSAMKYSSSATRMRRLRKRSNMQRLHRVRDLQRDRTVNAVGAQVIGCGGSQLMRKGLFDQFSSLSSPHRFFRLHRDAGLAPIDEKQRLSAGRPLHAPSHLEPRLRLPERAVLHCVG